MSWHDTPPTKAGTYWVKGRTSGEEWPMRLHEDGAFEGHPSEVQFGPRIPTADELAELPGLIDKLVFSVADSSSRSERNEFDSANRLMDVVDDTKAKINAILGVA